MVKDVPRDWTKISGCVRRCIITVYTRVPIKVDAVSDGHFAEQSRWLASDRQGWSSWSANCSRTRKDFRLRARTHGLRFWGSLGKCTMKYTIRRCGWRRWTACCPWRMCRRSPATARQCSHRASRPACVFLKAAIPWYGIHMWFWPRCNFAKPERLHAFFRSQRC